jgi:hypothetical protein
MAGSDPVTDKQLAFIFSLAEGAVSFYEDEDDLNALVRPIYGCVVRQMNRSQAGMLIDDLLVEMGDKEGPLDYPSIFGDRIYVPKE